MEHDYTAQYGKDRKKLEEQFPPDLDTQLLSKNAITWSGREVFFGLKSATMLERSIGYEKCKYLYRVTTNRKSKGAGN
jgi:hypothetical protein